MILCIFFIIYPIMSIAIFTINDNILSCYNYQLKLLWTKQCPIETKKVALYQDIIVYKGHFESIIESQNGKTLNITTEVFFYKQFMYIAEHKDFFGFNIYNINTFEKIKSICFGQGRKFNKFGKELYYSITNIQVYNNIAYFLYGDNYKYYTLHSLNLDSDENKLYGFNIGPTDQYSVISNRIYIRKHNRLYKESDQLNREYYEAFYTYNVIYDCVLIVNKHMITKEGTEYFLEEIPSEYFRPRHKIPIKYSSDFYLYNDIYFSDNTLYYKDSTYSANIKNVVLITDYYDLTFIEHDIRMCVYDYV